jgi:hypothetical protein
LLLHSKKSPSAAPTALAVNGIRCSSNEQFLFHMHTHLDIFVNGQLMYIQPQIGIIPGKCIYWLLRCTAFLKGYDREVNHMDVVIINKENFKVLFLAMLSHVESALVYITCLIIK